jgi:hypothetical protein
MTPNEDLWDSKRGLMRTLSPGSTVETLSSGMLAQVVDHAIEYGYINQLRYIVSLGVCIQTIRRTHTPLLTAIYAVTTGPGVRNTKGLKRWEMDLRRDRLSIVQLLLDEGAKTDTVFTRIGQSWDHVQTLYTVMDLATCDGSFELVKMLLRSGVEVNEDTTLCLRDPRDRDTDLRINKLMRRVSLQAKHNRTHRDKGTACALLPSTTCTSPGVSSLDIDIEAIIRPLDLVDNRCRSL